MKTRHAVAAALSVLVVACGGGAEEGTQAARRDTASARPAATSAPTSADAHAGHGRTTPASSPADAHAGHAPASRPAASGDVHAGHAASPGIASGGEASAHAGHRTPARAARRLASAHAGHAARASSSAARGHEGHAVTSTARTSGDAPATLTEADRKLLELAEALVRDTAVRRRIEGDAELRRAWTDPAVRRVVSPRP